HVGGLLVPAVGEAALHLDRAPVRVALEHVGVFRGEHLLVDGLAYHAADLAARRPDVLEEHLLALLVEAERLLEQIRIHRAGEPGASEVFTHGLTVRPFATALRASRPAPIITSGLDVLVQEVIAAITTSPWPRS